MKNGGPFSETRMRLFRYIHCFQDTIYCQLYINSGAKFDKQRALMYN